MPAGRKRHSGAHIRFHHDRVVDKRPPGPRAPVVVRPRLVTGRGPAGERAVVPGLPPRPLGVCHPDKRWHRGDDRAGRSGSGGASTGSKGGPARVVCPILADDGAGLIGRDGLSQPECFPSRRSRVETRRPLRQGPANRRLSRLAPWASDAKGSQKGPETSAAQARSRCSAADAWRCPRGDDGPRRGNELRRLSEGCGRRAVGELGESGATVGALALRRRCGARRAPWRTCGRRRPERLPRPSRGDGRFDGIAHLCSGVGGASGFGG